MCYMHLFSSKKPGFNADQGRAAESESESESVGVGGFRKESESESEYFIRLLMSNFFTY